MKQITEIFLGGESLHRKRIQKFQKIGNLYYICENDLDKAYFTHNAVYADSKDLARRTVSDRVLKETAYEIALNPRYDEFQRELASMVYTFFNKKVVLWAGASVNEVLAQELHKPMSKKLKGRKVNSRLKDKIWAATLAEMGSLSFNHQNVQNFCCV